MMTRFWDWIDQRQVDKHLVSIAVLYGLWRITEWSMIYAVTHADVNGAAVIAAVSTPYSVMSGAAIKFYFESRTT